MATSETHYKAHLGPIYSWMLGDLDAAFGRAAAEIDELPLPDPPRGVAVDLGAGLGLHALPLAKRGFQVVAIDNCKTLLDELGARSGSLPITTHHANLLEFRALTAEPQVIVCMGDTLTHLPALSAIESLLQAVADSLARGGVFAATFRDYATRTLEGEQRFIPVRADDARIMTCFLEYQDHRVIVHDLVHDKENGRWRQSISSYPKLRLAPEWLALRLSELGFSVKRDATQNGMARIVAKRN